MTSYYIYDCVDEILYNKYYNPKIKNNFFKKSNLYNINNIIKDKDIFLSRYDETDYDTINDL